MRLIVGLGNPGKEHERSRHNAGFWLVERFAAQAGVVLRKDPKFQALVGRHEPNGAWLVLPQSYMNSSGRPVQMLAGFFRIPASEILVAHDELDFPPGTARIKQGGGIAGHNGLKDISQRLGTHEYWRLRIGIGHPGDKDAVTDYVLRRPSAEDRTAIDASIAKALEVLPLCLAGDLQGAMQKLHTQTGPEQAPKAEAQEPAPEPGEQRRTKEPAPKPQPKEPAPRAEKPTAQEPAKAQPGGTLRSLLGSLLHPTRKK
ncbi:MAG: aminoacyl-tRNA hydrolase [Burkholderiales bacterium]